MSLLTIVQQAFGEIGLGSPTQVNGSSDPNLIKADALVQRACLELRDATQAADYWPVLRRQFLFNLQGIGPFTGTMTAGSPVITGVTFTGTGTGLAGVQAGWQASSKYLLNDTAVVSVNVGAQTVTLNQNANASGTDTQLAFGQEAYPLPTDLNYWIPQTGWDRNFRWQMLGPVTAQEWQVLKSGISPVGPRLRYRLMQGMIYINPSPYVPTGQASPISDLIALSLKWRMLKALGMSYLEEYDEYEKALQRRAGRETMPRNLPMNARSSGIRLLNAQNVPETGFGS